MTSWHIHEGRLNDPANRCLEPRRWISDLSTLSDGNRASELRLLPTGVSADGRRTIRLFCHPSPLAERGVGVATR